MFRPAGTTQRRAQRGTLSARRGLRGAVRTGEGVRRSRKPTSPDADRRIRPQAIKEGHLTVVKAGKKNIFSGRILEIEGLEHLKCEQVPPGAA